MPLFCVSDLHACDKGPRDNFAYEGREVRFNNFLDMVLKERGELLILGDLLDFWQVPVGSAVKAYLPLLDRLAGMNAQWVIGNHDNAMEPLRGTTVMLRHPLFERACGPFDKVIGGRKFTFLHGHETDPYCCDLNPGIGEITAIISGLLEDRNKGPMRQNRAVEDEFIGVLEGALSIWRRLTFQHSRQAEMVAAVDKYRLERQADVVVYGHTHVPGRMGDYHFNTGSWARSNDTYARIEDDGSVNLLEWLGTWSKTCNTTL